MASATEKRQSHRQPGVIAGRDPVELTVELGAE